MIGAESLRWYDWIALAVMYFFAVYLVAGICGFNDEGDQD